MKLDTEKALNFVGEPTSMAWLDAFANKRQRRDDKSFKNLEATFPWPWDASWCNTVSVDTEGVAQMKNAIRHAESMKESMDSFLDCLDERLERMKGHFSLLSTQTYFHLLSDDILAMIFEFASLPTDDNPFGDRMDCKSVARLSSVSLRFRNITLRLSRLWRSIDLGTQSWADVNFLLSRNANAGPILEVRSYSELRDRREQKKRHKQLSSHMDWVASIASRITYLRFDFIWKRDEVLLNSYVNNDAFEGLSFPSLQELRVDYEEGTKPELEGFPMFRFWSLPALRTFRIRNILPYFDDPIRGVSELSLHITACISSRWKYKEVADYLNKFPGLKTLDLLLHGDAFERHCDIRGELHANPEYMKTAFPGVRARSVWNFLEFLESLKKKTWILDIDDTLKNPKEYLLGHLFPLWPITDDPLSYERHPELKEMILKIRNDTGKFDYKELKRLPLHATKLETLRVSYSSPWIREFAFRNCNGKVEEMVNHLEGEIEREQEPEDSDSCFVLDGLETPFTNSVPQVLGGKGRQTTEVVREE